MEKCALCGAEIPFMSPRVKCPNIKCDAILCEECHKKVRGNGNFQCPVCNHTSKSVLKQNADTKTRGDFH